LKSHELGTHLDGSSVANEEGEGSEFSLSNAAPIFENPDLVDPVLPGESQPYSRDVGVKILTNLLGNFCSSLLASGVNNSTVDLIVKELQYCFSESFSLILKIAEQFIGENFQGFSEQLMTLLSVFQKVKSSYQRQQLFQKSENFVLPVEKGLGTRTEVRVRDAKRQQVIVPDTFMYVPLLKTLDTIISCPQFTKYFQPDSMEGSSGYEFFKDSKSFKSNQLFSKFPHSIQIQLFYDDFETVNPLGSKRGVHKIGALYFTLRNLPDFFNSNLNQIYLLGLFYTEDAKKYGISSILRQIIPDIQLLETQGVKVQGTQHFGTLCSIVHDNLGGNTLLGFMESFSANYYCRICCTSKSDAQNIFDHNAMIIRDRSNYSDHLSTNLFGVQTGCEFNKLKYFNFLDSPTADIMHDLLEEVVPFEIKLVLQKLISLGAFNLETVNLRILGHDFGYLEAKNRPSPIRLDGGGNKIGQKAAQAWCLIRFLPVLAGDLIVTAEQLKHWELILKLLECMSLIFSRKFSESMIQKLHSSIIDHHQLFKELHPDVKLLPKHHLMYHYSYIIRQIGHLYRFGQCVMKESIITLCKSPITLEILGIFASR